MAEPTDLSTARWKRLKEADNHAPREALAAALRHIDEGLIDPTHVTIIARLPSGEVRYFNAGPTAADPSQVIGALERTKLNIHMDGRKG